MWAKKGAADLDTHWRRGGLRESLFAPSDAISEVRLDAIIAGGLFAIQTIMFGPGEGAAAAVWRKDDDEIDLILRWPDGGERWAIEIGMGTDKRASSGFWRGASLIKASRKLIVHRGACDIFGECEQMTLEQLLSA
jgi:hypothetical protein